MFETNWDILNEEVINEAGINNIDPIIQNILRHKGICNEADMKEFLSSKPQKTYDPFLLKNMDKIVATIISYIKANKNIWIYGDYDVDGITSIALLMEFLGNFTQNLHYYIPSRAEEGYGLNCEAIQEIKKGGADLVITVDCGSTSVKEVALAKELGLEIIVTDHHNMGAQMPDCLILNPKQEDCLYPFKALCGCGLAFKLAQAIQKTLNAPKKYLNDLLDLVALGTVADVVPLIDENRTMLKYGLKRINELARPGLRQLIEAVNLHKSRITSTHIGFVLAPYFNASGRIDDAKAGVELLLTLDEGRIQALTEHLKACNEERKMIQDHGLELCREKVEKHHREELFLVVDAGNTHEGVIGIIAGRIRDLYYKPTLIITASSEEHVLKGSGRSIEGIDIYEEMKKCEDLFIKFGGHKNACGFSIQRDKIDELRKRLNEQAKEKIKEDPDIYVKTIKIYSELKPQEITEQLIAELEKIEPFGMGNEKPYFLVKALRVNNLPEAVMMGKNQEHLRLTGVSSIYSDTTKLQAVGFGMAGCYIERLRSPEVVDLVGFPRVNEWNGYKNIQFQIHDMK